MPSLSPPLQDRLRNALLKCEPFDSNAALRAVFSDARISAWQHNVPEASNRAARVSFLVSQFLDAWNAEGQNALSLFLCALVDSLGRQENLAQELCALSGEIHTALIAGKIAECERELAQVKDHQARGWSDPAYAQRRTAELQVQIQTWGACKDDPPLCMPVVAPVAADTSQRVAASGAETKVSESAPEETYTDLELHITPRKKGRYAITAELDGESKYRGVLQMDAEERERLSVISDPGTYGLALFDAVFTGDIRAAYTTARERARAQTDARLRLRLWIDDEAADLHALVWERLHYRRDKGAFRVATDAKLPFSRYFSLQDDEAAAIAKPVRMLCVIANPQDLQDHNLSPLDVEAEINNLCGALDGLRKSGMAITIMPGQTGLSAHLMRALPGDGYAIIPGPATLSRVYEALAYAPGYHLLHFVGHGVFSPWHKQAALFLEDDAGQARMVTDDDLVSRLAGLDHKPHLIFLAACESASRPAGEVNPFVGLAPRLVQIGIPAVIAMQDKIDVSAAQTLTRHFYRFLLLHGIVDKALNQARGFLVDEEWDVPALFTRLKNGRLFIPPGTRPSVAVPPSQTSTSAFTMAQVYVNGIDGTTGDYSLPPMSSAALAGIIKGESGPGNLNELQFKKNRPVDSPVSEAVQDPTDLAQAGWAVVFPATMDEKRREAIKEALSPLLQHRQEKAGDLYRVFESEAGYREPESKADFCKRQSPEIKRGPARPEQMPFYVLLVGSPEEISFEFQFQLDVMRGVGRLDFGNDLEAYARYAQSVVAAETGAIKLPRKAAFFSVRNPGDNVTLISDRYLVHPLLANLQQPRLQGEIPLKFDWKLSLTPSGNKKELIRLLNGKDDTPALLFIAAHGMVVPLSIPPQSQQQEEDALPLVFLQQRLREQGAVLCQGWSRGASVSRGDYFAAEDLGNVNLLGLIAMFFTSYSVGTPKYDYFTDSEKNARPQIEPFSFTSALPKRMLTQGALAVIGHVDRAWGHSFISSGSNVEIESFVTAMRKLLNGDPIGLVTDPSFNLKYADMTTTLSEVLQELQYNPTYLEDEELVRLWTASNDTRSYAVLGDPAARIPFVQKGAAVKRSVAPVVLPKDLADRLVALQADISLSHAATAFVVTVDSPEAGYLNVRAAPYTGADLIDTVQHGTILDVLEDKDTATNKVGKSGQWLCVRLPNKKVGYVPAWYLKIASQIPSESPDIVYFVAVNSPDTPLKLRQGPGVGYTQIDLMPHGTRLKCLEPEATVQQKIGQMNQWLNVQTPSGITGYTAAWYVSLDDSGSQPVIPEPKTGEPVHLPEIYYKLWFTEELPRSMVVGQNAILSLELVQTVLDDNSFRLPPNTNEVYCFLSSDLGLKIEETEVREIIFGVQTERSSVGRFKLQAHLIGERPYTIELFAEDPDSGRISIYKIDGIITVLPPPVIEERPPMLSPLDIRVAPQPGFVLDVATTALAGKDGVRQLTYYLSSRVPGLRLHNQKVGSVILQAADYARIQTLLQTTLPQVAGVCAADARERLLILGKSLFNQLFPSESTGEFCQALWQVAGQLTTWLIRQDEHTWLPWELLVPYRANENAPLYFLGERYQLSRWIEGLGPPLYGEVPFGEIALAHYKVLEAGMEDQDEDLLAWRKVLQAPGVKGIQSVVKPETPFYGVHLLQHAEPLLARQEIVTRDATDSPASPEQDAAESRLHLRLKRPVITLSILGDNGIMTGVNADEWLLPDRVLPFLRAGASAVVGPWWPTSEAADHIFWPTFYDLLERRVSLGESVWRARLTVQQALPERPDWLAYTLFGDPRARAYWPESSEGYTVLECLNPDDPLCPGKTYTFRVSLRTRPPVAYTDRLVKTETLPEKLRALFLAPNLQTTLAEPVEMTPLGRMMLQATLDLTPPAPGDYPLLVQLLEGDEHLKTLQMTLKVRAAGGSAHA